MFLLPSSNAWLEVVACVGSPVSVVGGPPCTSSPYCIAADWLLQPVYTTESICFDSIRLQGYVYTSGAESNQFDLGSILGTAFTRVVHI